MLHGLRGRLEGREQGQCSWTWKGKNKLQTPFGERISKTQLNVRVHSLLKMSLILGGDYIMNYGGNTGGAHLGKKVISLILNKLLQMI